MPICNYEGEVIGVAQIINKTNDTQEFTAHDVEVTFQCSLIQERNKFQIVTRSDHQMISDFHTLFILSGESEWGGHVRLPSSFISQII
jgi:hypothetical protein